MTPPNMFDSGVFILLGEIKEGVESLKRSDADQKHDIEAIKKAQQTTNVRLGALEIAENSRKDRDKRIKNVVWTCITTTAVAISTTAWNWLKHR